MERDPAKTSKLMKQYIAKFNMVSQTYNEDYLLIIDGIISINGFSYVIQG